MWKMLLAAVLMAEAMWFVTHRVTSDTGWSGFAQLMVGGVVGLTVYVVALIVLRVPEMSRLPGLARLRTP